MRVDPLLSVHTSLFDLDLDHVPVPTKPVSAAAGPSGQGRPLGRRHGALPLRGRSGGAGLSRLRAGAIGLCVGWSLATPMTAQASCVRDLAARDLAGHVQAAAVRFGLPEAWIGAVLRAESGGDPCAVSAKGALGLMQVMPATYADLRARYHLGEDPFQPADNVTAGAGYLRELYDRFGLIGALAAYNVGPSRWTDYLTQGRPLPDETVTYVRRLSSRFAVLEGVPVAPPAPQSLFVTLTKAPPDVGRSPGGLFVPPSSAASR